ncbi:MAG: membrane integrity-associated transporter subunit PqiC [Calditrichaceae bacterium]|nr:membrane integrity-associated transporter subunit PqiC [Calditrichaceae bacterium]MBN2710464.1 membrane integrity-associated transporter subunit PqiC [Calditrichaceae bacterium]RQV93601.1 MAG: hypothetical protein EH224_12060 [Calditrichota bacterium]
MKALGYILLISFLFFSCGSKKILTKYYLLDSFNPAENQSLTDTTGISPIPGSVYIQKIDVVRPYDDNTIALRMASNEIQHYVYHKWAERPADGIRRYIWQECKKNQVFEYCDISMYQIKPDYEVTGLLEILERVGIEDHYGFRVKMYLDLRKTGESQILLAHDFDRFIPLEESAGMNVFAAGVAHILNEELDTFIQKIRNYFKYNQ